MANLSFSALEDLWMQAGGPRLVAPIAAAIALAESSGNPDAINPTDNNGTQTSWGLWQISNGTHAMPVPGILDPLTNARAAVGKYRGANDTFAPWGTYASGAYKRYLPSGYSAPPQAQAQDATLTGFKPGDILNPFQVINDIANSLGSAITKPASMLTSVTRLATDFNSLVTIFNVFLKDFEWLFVPSHWIRIMAFLFGVGALAPGVWALLRVGQARSGDITLALGILLVMLGSMMLFIAFHNLPVDVKNLGELLGWISSEIRGQQQGQQAAA